MIGERHPQNLIRELLMLSPGQKTMANRVTGMSRRKNIALIVQEKVRPIAPPRRGTRGKRAGRKKEVKAVWRRSSNLTTMPGTIGTKRKWEIEKEAL